MQYAFFSEENMIWVLAFFDGFFGVGWGEGWLSCCCWGILFVWMASLFLWVFVCVFPFFVFLIAIVN